MPAINRTFNLSSTGSPRPLLLHLSRHSLTTTSSLSRDSQFHRSDFQAQGAGFSSIYEPGRPTEGPLAQASKHGAPRLTPSLLKEHLDKFVVGQDKAKKVTSVAIYNHYQRIRELRRQEAEEQAAREQQARWELGERERVSHPVESLSFSSSHDPSSNMNISDEYPGHVETVDLNASTRPPDPEPELGSKPLEDDPRTIIEKSNLLLLGPSGVGKTYILSTLARVLEVPFATVDCSALTQAGYIGTDIESAIERLLLASSHSISKCETGIIFFDEVDKLAKPAVMTHGRDVSGEGVQQGLLKMIEGTTVTVNTKSDRSSKSESTGRGSDRMERSGRDGGIGQQPGKSEQYTIDTSNILFVFAGAFVGLEKIISSRLSSGSSIGFGAQLKSSPPPPLIGWTAIPPRSTSSPSSQTPPQYTATPANTLDHVTPTDLQTYGLIPELLGRIPILVSLSPLTLPHLVSILTEPRNSLVKQFIALFSTYNIELKFSTGALHAIAERALAPATGSGGGGGKGGERGVSGGIGARGLRSIMESVLGEIMFWGPGSAIRFCLVDEKFVRDQHSHAHHLDHQGGSGKSLMPRCWSRGQGRMFEEAFEKEEEAWKAREEERGRKERGEVVGSEADGSFERLRSVGGSGM
jgi:ATP-dependent Clp protease ATP-binding subunit ClpX